MPGRCMLSIESKEVTAALWLSQLPRLGCTHPWARHCTRPWRVPWSGACALRDPLMTGPGPLLLPAERAAGINTSATGVVCWQDVKATTTEAQIRQVANHNMRLGSVSLLLKAGEFYVDSGQHPQTKPQVFSKTTSRHRRAQESPHLCPVLLPLLAPLLLQFTWRALPPRLEQDLHMKQARHLSEIHTCSRCMPFTS
jgi:hypothetical protein